MLIILYFSLFFFLCGISLMLIGIIRRIKFNRDLIDLIPEYDHFEQIELVFLLNSYYNSTILLGIPLFCLGITITHSLKAFIINLIVWVAFLIFSDVSYRKLQKLLKSKALNLKTLLWRMKYKRIYKYENQTFELKSYTDTPFRLKNDRDYKQSRRKVA